MSLKDLMLQDALKVLINSDEFAEDVSYLPETGWPRTIKAVVNRQREKPGTEHSGALLINQVEMVIAKDATNGVISIKKGKDTFSFPAILRDDPVEWVVADIIAHDDGAWHLLMER